MKTKRLGEGNRAANPIPSPSVILSIRVPETHQCGCLNEDELI